MQFDLSRFLTAMLAAFLDCQDDGVEEETPRALMLNNPVAVRFAARRELRRQAKKQGANRRDRRKFVDANIKFAMESLEREVEHRCKDSEASSCD